MECVANFEIKTDCSVIEDDLILRIKHPKDLYRVRIQNIPRSTYTVPFLVALHLYFDAPALDKAQEIADGHLADCMNMLAFATGATFRRHRTRQIVDASPGVTGMRSLLMWGDSIEYEDPQPFLSGDTTKTIECLMECEVPAPIRRAMRWYRLGINAPIPDDQFMNFWFALEIVAEFQKSTEKVPSKCSKCQSPLYCEKCGTHPVHRPYPKQAIRSLLKTVDSACDDAIITRLDTTRNGLMHGSTLLEIEGSLSEPHEHIVDILGRLLWKALIYQFPKIFEEEQSMGYPSTYIHKTVQGVAHMQTVVHTDKYGDLDLSFKGTKMEWVPHGPPQSALPTVVSMSLEQHERLRRICLVGGEHQKMCRRIYERFEAKDGQVRVLILSSDMAEINEVVKQKSTGEWQELFREILGK